jgi:hypothetical protein
MVATAVGYGCDEVDEVGVGVGVGVGVEVRLDGDGDGVGVDDVEGSASCTAGTESIWNSKPVLVTDPSEVNRKVTDPNVEKSEGHEVPLELNITVPVVSVPVNA